MHHIVEIALHGLHQRNLRGDTLCGARGGEVGSDGLGNVALGIVVDLRCEVAHQLLPVGILREQVLLRLHHEVHLVIVAHQLIAHLLRVGIDIAGEALTDEHPHHVGREHQRTMLGIGPHNGLEEHILAFEGVELLVVGKTPGYRGVSVTRYALVAKDTPDSLVSTTQITFHRIFFFYGREVLVDHKRDALLGRGRAGHDHHDGDG